MNYTDKQQEDLFKQFYDGSIDPSTELPESLYMAIGKHLEKAVYEGYGKNVAEMEFWPHKDYDLVESLRNNVYMFSGAKTYQQCKDMAALAAKANTFADFKKEARKVYDQYNVDWLKAEYNTAVGQAVQANQWSDIEADKELFPYVRYVAVMDKNTSEICRPLDGMTLPVDHPLWNKYTPLNHFNCRCILEKIDKYEKVKVSSEARVKSATKELNENIDPEFKMNPGKDGYIFSPEHPYFEVAPKDKAFAKRNFDLPIPPMPVEEYKDTKINYNPNKLTNVEAKEMLKLAGVPKDFTGTAEISVEYTKQYGKKVDVRVSDLKLKMERSINFETKSIYNEYFVIPLNSKYKGTGAQIFKNQVDYATSKGFKEIKTEAARGEIYNGYYTWARLGYVPNFTLKTQIEKFNYINKTNVKDFKELMSTKAGQEYWKEKGIGFDGIFDLNKDSYSQKTLKNYIDGKGKK